MWKFIIILSALSGAHLESMDGFWTLVVKSPKQTITSCRTYVIDKCDQNTQCTCVDGKTTHYLHMGIHNQLGVFQSMALSVVDSPNQVADLVNVNCTCADKVLNRVVARRVNKNYIVLYFKSSDDQYTEKDPYSAYLMANIIPKEAQLFKELEAMEEFNNRTFRAICTHEIKIHFLTYGTYANYGMVLSPQSSKPNYDLTEKFNIRKNPYSAFLLANVIPNEAQLIKDVEAMGEFENRTAGAICTQEIKQMYFMSSAVSVYLAQEKPDEFANEEGCYVPSIGRVLPYEEPYSPQDGVSCIQYACRDNNVTMIFTCGALIIDDGCAKVAGDKTLPYPECCDSFRCNEIGDK